MMKKKLLLVICLTAFFTSINAVSKIGVQADLEKLFRSGTSIYDFAGLPADGGGDLWYAEGWSVNVLTADFNGDGNKDVFVSGNVSIGEVLTPSLQNALYLGDGTGKFKKYVLSGEGTYLCGGAAYVKIGKSETIIATTGSTNSASWWAPEFNYGMKSFFTTTLHHLSFSADGTPVWVVDKVLPDGAAGSGVGLHLRDFNNDGNYDVLVSGNIGLPADATTVGVYGGDDQVLFLGDGAGNFTRKGSAETGLAPIGNGNSMVADLNGDGFLDVVSVGGKSGKVLFDATQNGAGTGVTVSINKGNGTFTTKTLIASELGKGWFFGSEAPRVQVADFNNDGKIDIWAGNNDQKSVSPWIYRGSFFMNDGNGNFTEYNKDINGNNSTPVGTERAIPVVADFNQDGNLDLWYNTWLPTSDPDDLTKGNNLKQLVGVLLLGNGTGGFDQNIYPGQSDVGTMTKMTGDYQRLCALKTPVYAVADFNKDGVPDMVIISGDAANISFRGITYVMGAAQPSSKGIKLPEDNSIGIKTGLNPIGQNNSISAFYNDGTLTITGANNKQVKIYAISGQTICTFKSNSDTFKKTLSLVKGVYIVETGNSRTKVSVN